MSALPVARPRVILHAVRLGLQRGTARRVAGSTLADLHDVLHLVRDRPHQGLLGREGSRGEDDLRLAERRVRRRHRPRVVVPLDARFVGGHQDLDGGEVESQRGGDVLHRVQADLDVRAPVQCLGVGHAAGAAAVQRAVDAHLGRRPLGSSVVGAGVVAAGSGAAAVHRRLVDGREGLDDVGPGQRVGAGGGALDRHGSGQRVDLLVHAGDPARVPAVAAAGAAGDASPGAAGAAGAVGPDPGGPVGPAGSEGSVEAAGSVAVDASVSAAAPVVGVPVPVSGEPSPALAGSACPGVPVVGVAVGADGVTGD
ncbi:hypothetical protein ACFQX8_25795 [Klenkia terrae]|uniref:hypothetical protein n=1 Tax=Klenkia terrae TaxID=1052259 RepID=UPI003612FD4C